MPSSSALLVNSTSKKQQQKTIVCHKQNSLTDSFFIYECLQQLLDTLNLTMIRIEKGVRGVR